jgi:hypothetical protein
MALTLPVSGGPHGTDARMGKKACRVARPLQWVVRPGVQRDVASKPTTDVVRVGSATEAPGKESLLRHVNFGH